MTRLTVALLALVVALPVSFALAQGSEQLAKQLGVDADEYTTSELIQMKCIIDGDHSAAERQRLLDGIKGYGAVSAAVDAAAKDQLAGSLGVDASEFTVEQLVMLKGMMEDDQCSITDPIQYVKAGESLTPQTASAKVQIAEALGVSPTAYTLSELVKMHLDTD